MPTPTNAATSPAASRDAPARNAEQAVLAELGRNATLASLFLDPVTRLPLPGVAARCTSATRRAERPAIRCLVWLDRGGTRVERAILYRRLAGSPRLRLVR